MRLISIFHTKTHSCKEIIIAHEIHTDFSSLFYQFKIYNPQVVLNFSIYIYVWFYLSRVYVHIVYVIKFSTIVCCCVQFKENIMKLTYFFQLIFFVAAIILTAINIRDRYFSRKVFIIIHYYCAK